MAISHEPAEPFANSPTLFLLLWWVVGVFFAVAIEHLLVRFFAACCVLLKVANCLADLPKYTFYRHLLVHPSDRDRLRAPVSDPDPFFRVNVPLFAFLWTVRYRGCFENLFSLLVLFKFGVERNGLVSPLAT